MAAALAMVGAFAAPANAETIRSAPAVAAPAASAAMRGSSGPWYIDGGAKWPGRATPSIRVKNAHVRICYNFWGSGTRKGFTIRLDRRGTHGVTKTIWSKKYWGPKNKTCSPWKAKNSGSVQAIMSVRKKAYGQVWFYTY
ncbi:hypothetical protein [Spirillospora sp. CA-128828]|uniref:hypothetical protein n=1 Tax=Spirillospora sp. CA-128828 TaxID=3240033 RepID=UPI003D922B62